MLRGPLLALLCSDKAPHDEAAYDAADDRRDDAANESEGDSAARATQVNHNGNE